jgi:chitosanase
MSLKPPEIDFIRRILSVAETGKEEWDPSAVYIYADDNRFSPPRRQITLSIGFTEGGGNLKTVLESYQKTGTLVNFAPYLPGMGDKGRPSLCENPKFVSELKAAGKDPIMVQAQKACFDQLYLGPAFAWAEKYGFVLPLSYLVIADSFLHSGSMLPFLVNSFPEKKPVDGGDEKKWIEAYLKARKNWLANHSNKVLNKTVYRVNCYLSELTASNWDLTSPAPSVVMNGTTIRYNPTVVA